MERRDGVEVIATVKRGKRLSGERDRERDRVGWQKG